MREWRIGFAVIKTTIRLSQNTISGFEMGNCNFVSSDFSQVSLVPTAKLMHSTSVLDLDTTCYFLDDQEIGFKPINTQYPVVDFLSSGSEP